MRKISRRKILVYGGALLLLVWTLAPIYWMINMSLSTTVAIGEGRLFPSDPTLCNYVRIFSDTFSCHTADGASAPVVGQAAAIRQGLVNSLIISVVVTLVTMIVSIPAAYAIGRLVFKHKVKILTTIVLSRSLPPVAVLIPFSSMYTTMHLQGTILGLIIIYLTLTVPLVVWILSGFFASLPPNIEKLARTDGCTRFQALYRVLLGAAMPGVSAVAAIAFLTSWNEFTFALILTPATDAQPFPPTLAALFSHVSYPNTNAAAALLAMIPVMIMAYVFQRRIRSLNLVGPI
ncbi:carbohydrate ABC transporter permease [Micromonospora sp. NPDC049679]|uniref:carbohydrate ABC transporter permease n=1 Tax=Micromonospora sp. NPDC049679 TaxID=3155920 RepID=UPI0033F07D9F